jgi:probable rRNA maturation factor
VIILRKHVAGLSEASLGRFVTRAARAARLRGAINVLVTGDREMTSLNRRFRAKDMPTDILSFPASSVPLNGLAGDIAISVEIAARNARSLGHSPSEEVKILVLHGILHLAGYDHDKDAGEMARKEDRLRKSLGLPQGLIGRDTSPTATARGKKTTTASGKKPSQQVCMNALGHASRKR